MIASNDYTTVKQFKKDNFDWYRQKQQHQWQALQTWHRTSMVRKNIEGHPSIIGLGTLSYFLWCKNYCATSNPILTVLDSMILELVLIANWGLSYTTGVPDRVNKFDNNKHHSFESQYPLFWYQAWQNVPCSICLLSWSWECFCSR
jgi:hypothetical protein